MTTCSISFCHCLIFLLIFIQYQSSVALQNGLPSQPRLHFANYLVVDIVNGRKTATTRLADEQDPNSDLNLLQPHSIAMATSDKTGIFGEVADYGEKKIIVLPY